MDAPLPIITIYVKTEHTHSTSFFLTTFSLFQTLQPQMLYSYIMQSLPSDPHTVKPSFAQQDTCSGRRDMEQEQALFLHPPLLLFCVHICVHLHLCLW